MTVTLSAWLLPIAATVIVWLAAVFYRAGDYSHDSWGFGAAFDAMLRAVFGSFATLLIWLVFFATMWWQA